MIYYDMSNIIIYGMMYYKVNEHWDTIYVVQNKIQFMNRNRNFKIPTLDNISTMSCMTTI